MKSYETENCLTNDCSVFNQHHKLYYLLLDFGPKMPVNLLLVGRAGNGKSSTANSIFGEKIFNQRPSYAPPGSIIEMRDGLFINGKEAAVVEVPSFDIDAVDDLSKIEENFQEMREILNKCQPGFSAVLIFFKYGVRYTKQEKDAVMMIKSAFGDNVIKSHGVIIMTHGDSFDLDIEEDQTFEEWCQGQTGEIQELFLECENRRMLVNNRSKDDAVKKAQREKLLSLVTKVHEGTAPYTVKEYDEAAHGRSKILVTIKLPKFEIETRAVMSDLVRQLDRLCQDAPTDPDSFLNMKESLKELLAKVISQKELLQEENKDTAVLNWLLAEVSVTESRILTKIELVELMAKLFSFWNVVFISGSELVVEVILNLFSRSHFYQFMLYVI